MLFAVNIKKQDINILSHTVLITYGKYRFLLKSAQAWFAGKYSVQCFLSMCHIPYDYTYRDNIFMSQAIEHIKKAPCLSRELTGVLLCMHSHYQRTMHCLLHLHLNCFCNCFKIFNLVKIHITIYFFCRTLEWLHQSHIFCHCRNFTQQGTDSSQLC